jgi:hypothetical protein
VALASPQRELPIIRRRRRPRHDHHLAETQARWRVTKILVCVLKHSFGNWLTVLDIGPPRDLPAGEGEVSDDSDVEDDEQAWQLDEAAEGMTEKKESSQVAERELTVDELVHDFEAHHPPPPYSETPTLGRLQCPVVLPQKRPQSKDRGFVRAYAPMLADCGIDQATFLEFLDDFDKSTQVWSFLLSPI